MRASKTSEICPESLPLSVKVLQGSAAGSLVNVSSRISRYAIRERDGSGPVWFAIHFLLRILLAQSFSAPMYDFSVS